MRSETKLRLASTPEAIVKRCGKNILAVYATQNTKCRGGKHQSLGGDDGKKSNHTQAIHAPSYMTGAGANVWWKTGSDSKHMLCLAHLYTRNMPASNCGNGISVPCQRIEEEEK